MKAKLTFPNKYTAVLTLTAPKKPKKTTWQDGLDAMEACEEAVNYSRNYKTLKAAADDLVTIDWLEWLIEKFVTKEKARLTIYDGGASAVRAHFTPARCKAIEAALVKKAKNPEPFAKGTDARDFLEETVNLAEKEEF